MTALNDVLKAEDEAKQILETAKEKAETAVQKAKDGQKNKLEEEEKKLNEAAKRSEVEVRAKVAKLVESIDSEVEDRVRVIEKDFEAKKTSLKKTITERFK